MKRILTSLTVFLLLFNYLHGQQKIGVVNLESTLDQWNRAVQLDYMLDQKKSTLESLVDAWLNKLQFKYDQYDNLSGTPQQQDKLANDILNGQEEILAFERILVDSIPQYRSEVMQLIQGKIQTTVDAVAVANGYDLIIGKNSILFYQGEEDIDELIVTYTAIDLESIKMKVAELNTKLTACIERYTGIIEQY